MYSDEHEYTLSTDEFNKPRVLKSKDAIAQLLIHLILLEPGTYSNRPEMGVGLVSRYRYTNTNNIINLQNDIQNQIETYLPEFIGVDVNVSFDEDSTDNDLIIEIFFDGTTYKFETSKQEDNKIGLTDLNR